MVWVIIVIVVVAEVCFCVVLCLIESCRKMRPHANLSFFIVVEARKRIDSITDVNMMCYNKEYQELARIIEFD